MKAFVGTSGSAFRGHATGARFAATHWSVVLAAADERSGPQRRRALEELIRVYWFPLYAFVRRQGEPPPAAEDAVQGFFARLLDKKDLAGVDPAKGKFRSFLLASMKHFLSNQRARARALKRGGGRRVIPLDAMDAEARYAVEPVDELTPERLFDRRWALAVLEQVLARLRDDYVDAGKGDLYAALEPTLTGTGVDYAAAAAKLGMTRGAVNVAAHRLRRRYRDLLRDEIARTIDSPEQVAEEISYLLSCL